MNRTRRASSKPSVTTNKSRSVTNHRKKPSTSSITTLASVSHYNHVKSFTPSRVRAGSKPHFTRTAANTQHIRLHAGSSSSVAPVARRQDYREFSKFAPTSTEGHKFSSPRLQNKDSLMFTLNDEPGALQKALSFFDKQGINLTRLESKPCVQSNDYEFHVDFERPTDETVVKNLMDDLRAHTRQLNVLQSKKVPWFPRYKKDLDIIANEVLDSGELEADHPGFHDPAYRERRAKLAQVAKDYRYGEKIPRVSYTPEEIECWTAVYNRIRPLHEKYACAEHIRLLPLFEQNCGFTADNIPQLQDINDFLEQTTGFHIRPVAGLLSTRNFLYGLAFRTFFSTQYLRHPSSPFYTPEPDLIHEICHSVLFADQNFADFSQQIGLAAIGASDEQIEQLGRCYWFSVEFGLCKQNEELKAYGAGILSSFGELEYSMGLDPKQKPEYRPFDPFDAAKQTYPITTYQPLYYVADSFEKAKAQMIEFSKTLTKPFNIRYLPHTGSIDVDSNIVCEDHVFKKPVGNVYDSSSASSGMM